MSFNNIAGDLQSQLTRAVKWKYYYCQYIVFSPGVFSVYQHCNGTNRLMGSRVELYQRFGLQQWKENPCSFQTLVPSYSSPIDHTCHIRNLTRNHHWSRAMIWVDRQGHTPLGLGWTEVISQSKLLRLVKLTYVITVFSRILAQGMSDVPKCTDLSVLIQSIMKLQDSNENKIDLIRVILVRCIIK